MTPGQVRRLTRDGVIYRARRELRLSLRVLAIAFGLGRTQVASIIRRMEARLGPR